ncbi:MAG: hypothetical protein RIR49_1741 [Actinomycetota bacterium]|jgi:hypothetical protein
MTGGFTHDHSPVMDTLVGTVSVDDGDRNVAATIAQIDAGHG